MCNADEYFCTCLKIPHSGRRPRSRLPRYGIYAWSVFIALAGGVFFGRISSIHAASVVGDSVVVTPTSGSEEATIDLRSFGYTTVPGLTVRNLHGVRHCLNLRQLIGSQWYLAMAGSATVKGTNDRLLMQLGPSASNGYPSLSLYDPATGLPAIEFDAGSPGLGVAPSISVSGDPVVTLGEANGLYLSSSNTGYYAINSDGSASFAGGAFAVNSDGTLTLNVLGPDWGGGITVNQINWDGANASIILNNLPDIGGHSWQIGSTNGMNSHGGGKFVINDFTVIANSGNTDGSWFTIDGTQEGFLGLGLDKDWPQYRLDVEGDVNVDETIYSSYNAISIGDNSGSAAWVDSSGNAAFGGAIGIGTSAPPANLDVAGNARFSGPVRIEPPGDLSAWDNLPLNLLTQVLRKMTKACLSVADRIRRRCQLDGSTPVAR